MGKETTTTYEVTVTHRGNKKDFLKLFKPKGGQTDLETKVISTSTQNTEKYAKYSDAQKMVRALIKSACEAAGLSYSKEYIPPKGFYNLNYGYVWKGSKTASYRIRLHNSYLDLAFAKGLDAEGEIHVWDHNRSHKRGPAPWSQKWGYGPPPTKIIKINLANPDIIQFIANVVKKWGS